MNKTIKFLVTSACLAGSGLLSVSAAPAVPKAEFQAGRRVFTQICFACHQVNGQGMAGVYPPLAKSDFLLADHDRAIGIVMHGRQGPITVNGRHYNNVMPQLGLSDTQIADALTYVLNSWGNKGGVVTPGDVSRIRNQIAAK